MKLRQAISSLLAGAMICCTAAGCSSTTHKVEIKENPDGELSVYYLSNTSSIVREMLDKFQSDNTDVTLKAESFSSESDMDSRLATELASGKGPDVMIFDMSTSMDLSKMMTSNNFMDLKPWLDADKTFNADNYYNVLDAGNYNGKQMIMPIAFDTMFFLTTDENLQKAGISDEIQNMELKDCLNAISTALQYDEPEYIGLSSLQRSEALCVLLTEYTGYKLSDVNSRKVDIPEDFKVIADICRDLNKLQVKYDDLQSKTYSSDYVGQIRNTIVSIYNADPITRTKLMTEAYHKQEPMTVRLACMPSFNGADKYQAAIERCVCVNANTKNASAAYSLVRYLMDYETPLSDNQTEQQYSGMPISRIAVKKQLETAKTIGGKKLTSKDGTVSVSPLREEYADDILNCFDNISSSSIVNPKLLEIISDSMGPYFDGTSSDYDACVKDLENKLKLYVNE